MEKKQPGVILMVVGGALMVVGSFLTWLTAKIDLVAFADAIKKETGVDIGGMPGFSSTPNSSSIAGIKGWEGKLALIGGVLALALGIAAIVGKVTGSRASRFAFIGGALGIFGGLYVMLTKSSGIADAKAGAADRVRLADSLERTRKRCVLPAPLPPIIRSIPGSRALR